MDSGRIIAPMGSGGLLLVSPGPEEAQQVIVSAIAAKGLHFYRATRLFYPAPADILLFAMRRSGVAAATFRAGETNFDFRTASFANLDVVDVCPIPATPPLAAAAVGRDGTLVLFRNALREQNPMTVKFGTVQGVAYRILCCQGHIVVVTSKAAYFLAGLAERFLRGGYTGQGTTSIRVVEMEAIDATSLDDKYVYVATADNEICRFDMRRLVDKAAVVGAGRSDFMPTVLEPAWEENTFQREAEQMPSLTLSA